MPEAHRKNAVHCPGMGWNVDDWVIVSVGVTNGNIKVVTEPCGNSVINVTLSHHYVNQVILWSSSLFNYDRLLYNSKYLKLIFINESYLIFQTLNMDCTSHTELPPLFLTDVLEWLLWNLVIIFVCFIVNRNGEGGHVSKWSSLCRPVDTGETLRPGHVW